MPNQMSNPDEVCGKEKENGEDCERPAGWGVNDEQDNPNGFCKDHIPGKESKNQELKNRFVEILKNEVIPISGAADRIDRDQSTIWKWRQKDEEFDQRVKQAKETQKNLRAEKVEDSVFQRIIKGEAAASTEIFWLKNNADWKDNPDVHVEQHQQQGQSQKIPEEFEDVMENGVQMARQEGEDDIDGDSGQVQRQDN